MWIDVHPTRNHGPYFESTLNWLWYSSKICIHIYKLIICICIFLYIIFIYTREIWKTFLLYKVLIGWLECLRIIVREEFQGFEFLFPPEKKQNRNNWTNARSHQGFLELKTAWYFAKKKKYINNNNNKKKEDMEALEREKMSQSPIDFLSTCTAIKLLHSSCWNQWRVRSPKPTTLSSLHPSPPPFANG